MSGARAAEGGSEEAAEPPHLTDEAVAEVAGVDVDGSARSGKLLLAAALAPLFLAGAIRVLWPAALAGPGTLVWLVALLTFSVLTYFRGWRGSLVAGLAVLVAFGASEAAAALWRDASFRWSTFGVVAIVTGGLVLSMGTLAEQLHRRRREAFRLAFTDPASGLPRRRLLTVFLRQQVASARRGEELSVALFGLSGLDAFRQQHGAEAADNLLGRVGDVLLDNTRGADVAGRWTGDRFLAVLPDTGAEGARVFAHRAVEKLDSLAVTLSDGSLVHSDTDLRIGVATFDASVQDHTDLVRRAERALGAAAAPGGRRVTVFRSGRALAAG